MLSDHRQPEATAQHSALKRISTAPIKYCTEYSQGLIRLRGGMHHASALMLVKGYSRVCRPTSAHVPTCLGTRSHRSAFRGHLHTCTSPDGRPPSARHYRRPSQWLHRVWGRSLLSPPRSPLFQRAPSPSCQPYTRERAGATLPSRPSSAILTPLLRAVRWLMLLYSMHPCAPWPSTTPTTAAMR